MKIEKRLARTKVLHPYLFPELGNFEVVAVHRETGKLQFTTLSAPSQVDADDFVADVQPDWIVIRDNADLEYDTNYEKVSKSKEKAWQLTPNLPYYI